MPKTEDFGIVLLSMSRDIEGDSSTGCRSDRDTPGPPRSYAYVQGIYLSQPHLQGDFVLFL